MTNLRKDLELIEVVYRDGVKAVLTFLDVENGEVLEVNFNKQSYDELTNKFKDDPEKEKQVEEWSQEHFGCSFDELSTKVGVKKDIYKYDRFNSLWEVQMTEKFDVKDKGTIHQTSITRIDVDDIGIHIYYEIDGKEYRSNMNYAKYVETLKQWFIDPQQKDRQLANFKKKFGIDVKDKDEIVGKEIMVEVAVAFGKNAYGDIKKPNW